MGEITRPGLPAVLRRLLVGRGTYVAQSEDVLQPVTEMRAVRAWELFDENIALYQVVSVVPAAPAGQFSALAIGPVIAGTSKGRAAKNVILTISTNVAATFWAHTAAALAAAYTAPVIIPFADERFGSSAPVPIRAFQTSGAAGDTNPPAAPSVQIGFTGGGNFSAAHALLAQRIHREEGLSDSWTIAIANAAATALTVLVIGLLVYD